MLHLAETVLQLAYLVVATGNSHSMLEIACSHTLCHFIKHTQGLELEADDPGAKQEENAETYYYDTDNKIYKNVVHTEDVVIGINHSYAPSQCTFAIVTAFPLTAYKGLEEHGPLLAIHLELLLAHFASKHCFGCFYCSIIFSLFGMTIHCIVFEFGNVRMNNVLTVAGYKNTIAILRRLGCKNNL